MTAKKIEDEEDAAKAAIEEAVEEVQRVMSGPPREEKYEEEAEEVIKYIRNRGDLRIGQLILNAAVLSMDAPEEGEEVQPGEWRDYMDKIKADEHRHAFNIEDDELLENLKKMFKAHDAWENKVKED